MQLGALPLPFLLQATFATHQHCPGGQNCSLVSTPTAPLFPSHEGSGNSGGPGAGRGRGAFLQGLPLSWLPGGPVRSRHCMGVVGQLQLQCGSAVSLPRPLLSPDAGSRTPVPLPFQRAPTEHLCVLDPGEGEMEAAGWGSQSRSPEVSLTPRVQL